MLVWSFPWELSVRDPDDARVLGNAGAARRRPLHPRLRPASDGDLAGAHDLLDADRPQQLDQRLQLALVAAGHDRHPGDAGIERLAHRQALDVVTARREEPGHPREDAKLVLDEDRDRVLPRLAAVAAHLEARLRRLRLLAHLAGWRGQDHVS